MDRLHVNIRVADETDFTQLAEMKWLHAAEDDIDYGEHNLVGVDKAVFCDTFIQFLRSDTHYTTYVAEQDGLILSSLSVCLIPKIPKPNDHAGYIAYLTNVFTRSEYRNSGIGTALLQHIQQQLAEQRCELLFAWPSAHSVKWYARNGFRADNDIMECPLNEE